MLTQHQKKIIIDYNNLKQRSFETHLINDELFKLNELESKIYALMQIKGQCQLCKYNLYTHIRIINDTIKQERTCVQWKVSLFNLKPTICKKFKVKSIIN